MLDVNINAVIYAQFKKKFSNFVFEFDFDSEIGEREVRIYHGLL